MTDSEFAFVFDIDGVISKIDDVLATATETLQLLNQSCVHHFLFFSEIIHANVSCWGAGKK